MPSSAPYPTDLSGPSHFIQPCETGRRLVIFFGSKDLEAEKFNFLQIGKELNETCVFVNNGANHWYQWGIPGLGADFDATVATICRWRDAMQAEEICVIGSSMGGYAAIQYGAAVGARVLAFSTDAILAEPLSRSAAYFVADARPSCSDLRPLIAGAGADITLMLGERDATDIWAAYQLAQAGPLAVHSLIGVDHYVPSHLSRQSRLAPLLRDFVAGRAIAAPIGAGQAVSAKGHATALHQAQLAEAAKDWTRAEGQARRALDAYPWGEAANMILGWALFNQGKFAESAQALGSALPPRPTDSETSIRLAGALRRCGAVLQARQLLQQIVAREPGHHRAHYALAMTYLQTSDKQAARTEIQRALRILPRHQPYLDRLKTLAAPDS